MSERGDTHHIACWISKEDFARLEDLRWKARKTRSEWVREAVLEKIAREENADA